MSDDSAAERIRYRRQNAVDPETFLLDAGVVEPSERGENLRFAPAFTDRLARRLERVRDEGVEMADVGGILGVDETGVSEADRPYTAYKVHHTVYNWVSAAALELDVATDRALRAETDRWDDVPPKQRYQILQSLRSFQDVCLFCSGPLSISDETVESCCGDTKVVAIGCEDCDRRFLEFDADAVGGA